MKQPTLTHIELYAIGPDGEKQSWSSFLGPMYEAMIVAEVTFDNGLRGLGGISRWTEHDFDQTAFHATTLVAPFLLGKGLYDWPQTVAEMSRRHIPLHGYAMALFDIAWHDAKAKSVTLPIYQMLGAAHHKMRAYASSPAFDTVEQYIDFCHRMLDNKFTAIKIHGRGHFADDYAIVQAIHEEFGDRPIGWSLDSDSKYTLQEALRIGRLLDECQWDFFEEPIPDSDLDGFQTLAAALDIDIMNSGNVLNDIHVMKHAMEQRCWDRVRTDITNIGGFSGAADVMGLARAYRQPVELQCWGFTISQAANLHLMLANANCEYFELVTPYEKYEFGASHGFRPDEDGFVHPTDLPGLGISLDWDLLDRFIYLRRSFKA